MRRLLPLKLSVGSHPTMASIPDPQHEKWRIEIEAKTFQEGEPTTVMKAHQDFLIARRGYTRSGTCCLQETPVVKGESGQPADYIVKSVASPGQGQQGQSSSVAYVLRPVP